MLFIACDKQENDNLIGTWVQNANASPREYYVYELVFNDDLTFSKKLSSYRINSQYINELSGWIIRTGSYDINNDKLNLISKKCITWDSFSGGSPDTIFETQKIYKDCVFKLIGDKKLVLNYISYPADGPMNTIITYKKSK
jgi:hypothetical protein